MDETGAFLADPAPTRVRLLSGRTFVPLDLPTVDDEVCESNGNIEVTIEEDTVGAKNYEVGSRDDDDVDVEDNETCLPVITIVALDSSIVEGEDAEFRIEADPAPSSNLWINIDVDDAGDFLDGPAPTRVRLLSGRTSVPLNLLISCGPDGEIEVTIETGTGYTVGSPPSARVTVDIPCDPVITIEANDSSIVEGEDAEFTITATPAPTSNLWINIDVDETGDFLADPAPTRVRLLSGRTFVPLDLPTVDDSVDEADGGDRGQHRGWHRVRGGQSLLRHCAGNGR